MAVITSGIPRVSSLQVFSLCVLSDCLLLNSLVSCRMGESGAGDAPICAQGRESRAASVLVQAVRGSERSQQMQFPPWRVVSRTFLLC